MFEFEGRPVFFSYPREVVVCRSAGDLRSCFDHVERCLAKGYYAAGYVAYEAGYAFEPALAHGIRGSFPLMYFGIFNEPSGLLPSEPRRAFTVSGLAPGMTRADYTRHIARIQDHIRDGDVYQITYCLKHSFSFRGCAYALYRHLLRRQPVPYPAYIEIGEHSVLSLSPELFFRKTAGRVVTKPMKGSWPRASFNDALCGGWRLKHDPKNRAENVMIADLLRNDLGRVGSRVRVPSLFEVAGYRTIFQMTSTVSADVSAGIPFYDLFRSLFPSGSVTGAPKVKAMQVIRALEDEPRYVYTGAVGWISPRRDAFFNVPIRTLLIRGDQGEMGIGGGITWDSTAEGEWEEGLWKSRFLREAAT